MIRGSVVRIHAGPNLHGRGGVDWSPLPCCIGCGRHRMAGIQDQRVRSWLVRGAVAVALAAAGVLTAGVLAGGGSAGLLNTSTNDKGQGGHNTGRETTTAPSNDDGQPPAPPPRRHSPRRSARSRQQLLRGCDHGGRGREAGRKRPGTAAAQYALAACRLVASMRPRPSYVRSRARMRHGRAAGHAPRRSSRGRHRGICGCAHGGLRPLRAGRGRGHRPGRDAPRGRR
jgi:hypothetical protein